MQKCLTNMYIDDLGWLLFVSYLCQSETEAVKECWHMPGFLAISPAIYISIRGRGRREEGWGGGEGYWHLYQQIEVHCQVPMYLLPVANVLLLFSKMYFSLSQCWPSLSTAFTGFYGFYLYCTASRPIWPWPGLERHSLQFLICTFYFSGSSNIFPCVSMQCIA